MIDLYEINSNGEYFRFSSGAFVQTETYPWITGIRVEFDGDNRMTLIDSTGTFSGSESWLDRHAVSRCYITIYKYNESTQEIVEASRHLWEMTYNSEDISTFYKLSIPEEQLEDAKKLLADGIVQLYEIRLKDGVTTLHFKNDNSGEWQGNYWQGLPLRFEGYSSSTGDSYSRPSMDILNPDGAFSSIASSGLLTRATVTRYFVLYDDYVNNRNIYQKRTWVVWRVSGINKQVISLELRNTMDGVNFNVPARRYIPPEFPFLET